MLEKGIIVSPSFSFDEQTLKMQGLHHQTMRQCLLYWDKIELPTSDAFNLKTNSSLQLLIDAGILQRTHITLDNFSNNGNIGYGVIETQIETLKKMNETESGQWSIAQPANSLCMIGNKRQEAHLIEFELHNCIPVPSSHTSYEEILEFKFQRQNEYTAFKECLDEVYFNIIHSKDIPITKTHAITQLEASIADIEQVTSERFSRITYSSISMNFNPDKLLAHNLSEMRPATLLGFPLTLSPVVGSVVGSINLNLIKCPVPKDMYQSQKSLAYLLRTHSALEKRIGRNELYPQTINSDRKKSNALYEHAI